MIGIIGAMDIEIKMLIDTMQNIKQMKKAGMTFYTGSLEDKDVILVKCGIGKVNAAICTQVLIDDFKVDAIVNTGVAGGLLDHMKVCDVVISTKLIEHDMDVTALGYKAGQIPDMDLSIFKADPDMIDIAEKASKKTLKNNVVYKGVILSGDQFINSTEKAEFLKKTFDGCAVEMEGAAIAHTAYLNNIPFVIIRGLSDKADDKSNLSYEEFTHIAAFNSSEILRNMLKNWSK